MPIITIRKPNMNTPSYYILYNVFNPPHITIDDVNMYYSNTHIFYIEDEICEMNIDSDISDSNNSMKVSSEESNKMSIDGDNNDEQIQEKIKDIYYKINSVQNSFTFNYGDIIEFPNGIMYFYHTPCIKIN